VYESNPNLIRIAGFLVHVVNSLLMRVDGMSDFTQLARKLKDQFITFENRRIDLINIKSIGINFGFNKKKKRHEHRSRINKCGLGPLVVK